MNNIGQSMNENEFHLVLFKSSMHFWHSMEAQKVRGFQKSKSHEGN